MIVEIRKDSDHSVAALCQLFEVSQSGFYSLLNRRDSSRKIRRKKLEKEVLEVFHEHKARYGRPRIYRTLKAKGVHISEKMVGSLIRENNLQARKKKPFRPKTTRQGAPSKEIPNLLKKPPNPTTGEAPSATLVTDITYVATREGWLYLSAIMNLKSKYIHAYRLESHLRTELVTDTVEEAIRKAPELSGSVLHSDRGCQYTSHSYAHTLQQHQLQISMSATGNCYDNAAMESFWSTLKTESFPDSGVFETKEAAKQAIFEYIEGYYHTKRIHSSLNYLTPLAAKLAA